MRNLISPMTGVIICYKFGVFGFFIFFHDPVVCQPLSHLLEGLVWATLVHWKENVDLDKFFGSEMNIFRYEYELFCWKDTGYKSGQSRVETCDLTNAQKPVLILYTEHRLWNTIGPHNSEHTISVQIPTSGKILWTPRMLTRSLLKRDLVDTIHLNQI